MYIQKLYIAPPFREGEKLIYTYIEHVISRRGQQHTAGNKCSCNGLMEMWLLCCHGNVIEWVGSYQSWSDPCLTFPDQSLVHLDHFASVEHEKRPNLTKMTMATHPPPPINLTNCPIL